MTIQQPNLNRHGRVAIYAGTTTLWVKPENFEQTMLLAKKAIKTPSLKQARAAVLRRADRRVFPRFVEGMSTAQYVAAYAKANAMLALTPNDQFFQPLSDRPQFTQSGEVIEEAI